MPFGIDPATGNVLVGAFVAMATSAALNWNQRRVDRDRFRRALVHEVEHVGDAMAEICDDAAGECRIDDVEEALVRLSTDVIDADLAQVNKLTTSEIEAVYEFYEAVRLATLELERVRDDADHDPDRLYRQARRAVELRDRVTGDVTRSRLSRFTEWYKDRDSGRRR